jgi:hypothetical protein
MTPPKPKTNPAALLMLVRSWHTYVGMLIAPTVLFMAATGILQVYSLHEAHGTYSPPTLFVQLGSVHKDQVFKAGHHGPPPGQEAKALAAGASPAHDDPPPKLATVLLKAFFALAAMGLIGSTCAGLWMALRQGQSRRVTHSILLGIGTAIPLVLAALSA